MGDLLINFDANQNDEPMRNKSDQQPAGQADNPDDKSADLLTDDLRIDSADPIIDENRPDARSSNENHLDCKPNSLEEKSEEHEGVESRESEKKKVLQELNQRIIDEQRLNGELISKLHVQLDNAITEKEELVRKLAEKESDLGEVETILKQQKEQLKQLEDVELTNSKLKALAVKLKKELAEVKEQVSAQSFV